MDGTHRLRVLELHTSDLTASCLRSVKHRLAGEFRPEATTALFRGQAVGRAIQRIHEESAWESVPPDIATTAIDHTLATLRAEHWEISEAVSTSLDEIAKTIENTCRHYTARLGERLSRVRYVGCELPIRAPWSPPFASHLDLVFRDTHGDFGPAGLLHVWDFKFREEQPTIAYLVRNMQMMAYYAAVKEGTVLMDGEWLSFDEYPTVSWVHLPNLEPYKRATVTRDDDGNEQQYAKGDLRPLRSIIREVPFNPTVTIPAFHDEYALRATMVDAGHYPTNPDPVGCLLCLSESWCRRADLADSQKGTPCASPR